MNSSSSFTLPYQVRHYTLDEEIGKGGFGRVFHARSSMYAAVDFEFAVKVIQIPDQMDQTNRLHLRSFESEVSALKKLDHPNVIRLYDYFREDNLVFLVLEYCPNGTLEERLLTLTPYEKVKICLDIVNGLQYCHSMSFAHRDIKPANILFDAANRVKIADFGLSEFLIDANQKINKGEGSIYYVSPEITFKGPYSPFLSDIWAVGVLIYQVFENAYPFQGKCKEEVIQGIRSVDFSTRYSPKMITVIINHTLVFNPKERFSLAKISEILNSMITQHTCKLSTSPPRINSSFWPQQQFIHLPSMKDSASVNGNVIFTTVVSRPRRLTLHSHKPEPLHYIPQVCRSQGPPIMNQCLDDSQSPIRESRLNLEPSELRCISFKQGAAFFTSRR